MGNRSSQEALEIPGPAGVLEALLEMPRDESPTGVSVVCHPHPLHGGTMQNKVAHTLARAFTKSGFAALRFNFRGVGASSGEFDDGRGEVEDVLAALKFARDRFPTGPAWLAGFSFGAAVAISAAAQEDPSGLVSIAPAAKRFSTTLSQQPTCPWLIVHAESDELIPIDESLEWVDSLEPGPELIVFPDASHFFHGRLVELRETTEAFVARHVEAI